MARKLHIGGKVTSPDWEIYNILDLEGVDHQGNAKDLSRFENDTFESLYASHVLEHFDYQEELEETLAEWKRVLLPEGNLYVSVPDVDKLAELILDKQNLDFSERFFAMRMLFGGQTDQYDFHKVGLNEEFLTHFLIRTGFVDITRTDDFGFFKDTSTKVYKDTWISLNMIAKKPNKDEEIIKSEQVRRNDPCPCKSGKRYKHCCGASS